MAQSKVRGFDSGLRISIFGFYNNNGIKTNKKSKNKKKHEINVHKLLKMVMPAWKREV